MRQLRANIAIPAPKRDPVTETSLLPYSAAELEAAAAAGNLRAYDVLGAHCCIRAGQAGVAFAVWAPNATRVDVVGDFNAWQPAAHPLQLHRNTGIWQLFVPGLQAGALYKYLVFGSGAAEPCFKADPLAFAAELRPATASIVCDLSHYAWQDARWMQARARRQQPESPISIYEVHAGSWRRQAGTGQPLTYRQLAAELVPYVAGLGFSHIEVLPLTEHPLDASWGYQTTGYFAATSRFGTPHDLMYFVDACHCAGLGVILDWVPGHFPKDAHGLAQFDGTALYEYADEARAQHRGWGTYVFNYGSAQVAAFLINSALFWLDFYHIDGLRVDAVSSMLYLDYARGADEWRPNAHGGREHLEAVAFLQQLNAVVHAQFAGVITFAEEASDWAGVTAPAAGGGLGFDYKWNMGWISDMLRYWSTPLAARAAEHGALTFPLMYAFNENFLLPLSHDEVVHEKRSLLQRLPAAPGVQLANLRALLAFMFALPGKKLLFMGSELGAKGEWDYASQLAWELSADTGHAALAALVRDLNSMYRVLPALHAWDCRPEGFAWRDTGAAQRGIVAFERHAPGHEALLAVCNFSGEAEPAYHVGVQSAGSYKLLLNTDWPQYGGAGLDAAGALLPAGDEHCHGCEFVLSMALPALSVLLLQRFDGTA
ncbi:MAG: 1,4-alpha-glucan branching protein GlgB [Chloroflexi bacterium]|nr:1,4-alpha-glucan branching protein GlgB [Chloroflexota bacterium]